MFVPEHWAAAFIDSLETQGGKTEEGIDALKTLASWIKSLPDMVFGSSVAKKLEAQIRDGMVKAGVSSPALEVAVRFTILMVKKNRFRHIDSVIDETKKLLDKKNGVVPVTLEYVLPPGVDTGSTSILLADEPRIKEAIKERTGAARVDITERVNPDLIGGYLLRIGDEVVDASVRCQLTKLEAFLADGIFGSDAADSSNVADSSNAAGPGDGGN